MIGGEDVGGTVAAALRRRLPDKSWADVRRLCATGKVMVDDARVLDPAHRLRAGQRIAINMTAPEAGRRPRRVSHRAGGRPRRHHRQAVRHIQRPVRPQGDRDRDGPGARRVASDRQAGHRDAALHRAPHRQGHVGPALLRQDAAGRTRRCTSCSSATWRRAPTWPWPKAPSPRCASNRAWSPTGATASEAPPAARTRDKMPSPTSSHCGDFAALHYAGCTSKPDAHIKSASTCPNAGHPLVGETVYIRDLLRAGGKPLPAARLHVARGPPRLQPPGHRRPHRPRGAAARRISSPCSNRWEARVATSSNGSERNDPVGAGRRPGGHPFGLRRERGARRRTWPTAVTISHFLERTAPLLEFLWSRYFRVRLLGIENVPDTGAALLVGNHSGGIPYDGAMLLYAIFRDHPLHRRVRPLVANFAFRSGWMANVVVAHRLRARFDRDRAAVAGRRRSRCRVSRRSEGRRQDVSRTLSAGALRARRLRATGEASAGAVAARRRRRRRGDSPGDRQDHALRKAAGHPVHPNNPDVSVAWTTGLATGADQVDDPDWSPNCAAVAK